jgi:hypothetical protein
VRRRHNTTFLRQWVDKHVEDCDALLKKPCLVEEFGKTMGRWAVPAVPAVPVTSAMGSGSRRV